MVGVVAAIGNAFFISGAAARELPIRIEHLF